MIAEQLLSAGLDEQTVRDKVQAFATCDAALDAVRARAARMAMWVPGRIEILGKHTDYCGGRSLLMAVDRGLAIRMSPRDDAVVRVIDLRREQQCEIPFEIGVAGSARDWSNYVATVIRRFARDFPAARRGCDLAFVSDLPAAAGMSSSTALVVSVALAIIESNDLRSTALYADLFPTRAELASYLGAVESGAPYGPFAGDTGVGTFGGSEDHVAILACSAGHVSQFAYAPVRREGEWAFPSGQAMVVGVSGVTAHKGGNARDRYNRLSRAAARILDQWNAEHDRRDATLAAARASAPDADDRLRALAATAAKGDLSGTYLRNRLEHFIEESGSLVAAGSQAIGLGDMTALGKVADRSHRIAGTLLLNQTPETNALQRMARECGAVASSAFGAGFGGSVWAMLPEADASDFLQRWTDMYRAAYPDIGARAAFFVTRAAPPAQLW